jgi:hypothetical protein
MMARTEPGPADAAPCPAGSTPGSGAAALALFPALAVGLAGGSLMCVRTGRDAAYLGARGLDGLPLAYLVTQLGLAAAAFLHVRAMRRWGTRRVRVGAFALSSLVLAAFVPVVDREHPGAMGLLFPLVPVIYSGLFASAWLLTGDLVEGASRAAVQSAYAWTGVGATLGGLAGSVGARVLSVHVEPRHLVLTGAAALTGVAAVCALAHSHHPVDAADGPAAPGPGRGPDPGPHGAGVTPQDAPHLLADPALPTMVGISALVTISTLLVEFLFFASARQEGSPASYFATYYALTGVVALLLQITLGPALVRRRGPGGALLVLPGLVFLGGGALTVFATGLMQALFRVAETSVRTSVHQSGWEQSFLRFGREARGRIKIQVDGIVSRFAGGFAAGLLYLMVVLVAEPSRGPLLAAALALTGGAWLGLTVRLNRIIGPAVPPSEIAAAPPPDT